MGTYPKAPVLTLLYQEDIDQDLKLIKQTKNYQELQQKYLTAGQMKHSWHMS